MMASAMYNAASLPNVVLRVKDNRDFRQCANVSAWAACQAGRRRRQYSHFCGTTGHASGRNLYRLLPWSGEEQEGDIAVEYEGFRAWFEGRSEPYLEDAEVDYQEDQMGGQLTIKAPNARAEGGSGRADRRSHQLRFVQRDKPRACCPRRRGIAGGSDNGRRGRSAIWRRCHGVRRWI